MQGKYLDELNVDEEYITPRGNGFTLIGIHHRRLDGPIPGSPQFRRSRVQIQIWFVRKPGLR